MEPYITDILARLVPIINTQQMNKNLLENTATTIGRLGLVCPAQIAPQLGVFFTRWCTALGHIGDPEEKDHAFRGLMAVIKINPQGGAEGFAYLCVAIAMWHSEAPQELAAQFREVLLGYKQILGQEKWLAEFSKINQNVQQYLIREYRLSE
jgi:transportin-1